MSRRLNAVAPRLALLTAVVMVALTAGTSNPAGAGLLSNPSIGSVSPTVVFPGGNGQLVKIFGSFKNAPAVVTISGTGITQVGAPVTKSTAEINVTINVAANAPRVQRDVTIEQEGLVDGGTATCAKCLRVGAVITSVGGPVANSGASGEFTIAGQALDGATNVIIERKSFGFGAVENDSINISGVNLTVAPNGTSATARFNPLGRAPGRWKVSVVSPTGTATFGDGITTGLQITGSKPTLATISPARINSGQANVQFTLTGSGFARGMTATVSGTGVTQSAKVEWASLSQVTLRLTASASPGTGPRTLILRNADDQSSTNVDAISVNEDPQTLGTPTITSVTPSVLGQGASQVQMTVTGTNFAGPVPTVSVTPNDSDPTKKIDIAVTRDSSTQLTLTVSVGASTPAGARAMVVTNPGGSASAPKADAFSVSDQFVVSSLTPPGRPRGFNGNFVINGSGFSGTPTVQINPATDITVGAVTVNSPAKLTVNVAVGATAALDPRDVSVTIGGTTKTCDDCFTVGVVPTLTNTPIAPTSGNGGGQVSISAINGTGFKNPKVTLEREGQNPVSLIQVQTTGSTKISGTFDLTDAAPGKWALKVTNEDGGTVSAADAFTVVLPSPTATGVTPETVTQSTTGAVITVTGTAFAPGMTVTFPDPGGITVTDVTRKSLTSAEVKITTADNARLGARDIKVTNTDGKSGTCTSCFVVIQGTQAKNFGPGITAFENFNKGAFVAAGSLDGVPVNGSEFVVGANAGGGPHVKPFRVNPVNGNIQELGVGFFAYGSSFPGGVRVAMGDIDGNPANGEEIVTAAGPGGGPHVRVFHLNNDLTVSEPFGNGFFAYTPNFSGGVYVATGDVNGDGKDDIITGAGPGGGPHVRIFTLANDKQSWTELGGYFAYDSAFSGGVYVASGNVLSEDPDAPVKDEVITVPSFGGGPHVKIYNSAGLTVRQFFAFDTSDDQGYRATSGDFDFDTIDDVAIGRASSSEIYIAQITGAGPIRLVSPNPSPFGNLPTGTNLAAGDVDADGDDDLVLSPDHSSPVTIRLVRPLALT